MLVITHFVTCIIPKDSREEEDSNEDCRPDSLIEEEGNMDPSDAENRNDLEESSKPEVDSPSMISH